MFHFITLHFSNITSASYLLAWLFTNTQQARAPEVWPYRAKMLKYMLPHLPEIQPEAREIRMLPYSEHICVVTVVPMVSVLESIHVHTHSK